MQAAAGGGGGAVPPAGAMDSLGQQMAAFANAAKQGQFSVNDAGGKALLGAIQEMQQWLDSQDAVMDRLMRTGEYGESHAAGVVEPYMNQVASDHDGLLPMLKKFRNVLKDAEDAIHKAMQNYQRTDGDNASAMPNVRGNQERPPDGHQATQIPYRPPNSGQGPEVLST